MDLVDLNLRSVVPSLYFLVEILMDLVDLNIPSKLVTQFTDVEILMDLVDLNYVLFILLCANFSRDPYGSRGSKLIICRYNQVNK